ncbi:MAG: hypothetical protein U0235_01945 [Polyangiaceae bacterium]
MRAVYTEFFMRSPLLIFPLIGLALFMLVFSMVLVRTLGKRGRGLQAFASLLSDDAPSAPSSTLAAQRSHRS